MDPQKCLYGKSWIWESYCLGCSRRFTDVVFPIFPWLIVDSLPPQKLRLFLFGMQLLRSKQKMYQLLIDSLDSFVYVCACICMQACVSVCVCVCVIDWGFLGLFKKSWPLTLLTSSSSAPLRPWVSQSHTLLREISHTLNHTHPAHC